MNNKFFVGFNGLLIFALGAVFVGTSTNNLLLKEQFGLFLITVGVYMSGYFLAMRK